MGIYIAFINEILVIWNIDRGLTLWRILCYIEEYNVDGLVQSIVTLLIDEYKFPSRITKDLKPKRVLNQSAIFLSKPSNSHHACL